jgi:palmitoyltransferase
LVLGYGWWLTRAILSGIIQNHIDSGNVSGGFLNYKLWIEVVLSNLPQSNRAASALFLLCGTIFFIAFAFLIEHVRYIYLGVTTNETMKWDDVRYCIEHDHSLYFYDHRTVWARQASHDRNEPSIVLQKINEPENPVLFNRRLLSSESNRIQQYNMELKQLISFEEINNIYDLGFWNNLNERLFPDCI